MFEQPEDKETKEKTKILRENLKERLVNKDVLLIVSFWLSLFWLGFGLGFLTGRI